MFSSEKMRDVVRDVTLGGHQIEEQNAVKLQWNLIEIHELPLGIRGERTNALHYVLAPT